MELVVLTLQNWVVERGETCRVLQFYIEYLEIYKSLKA